MKRFTFIFILSLLFSISSFAQSNESAEKPEKAETSNTNTPEASKDVEIPADFKSDNCTFFPDGNYCDCCVAHDRDYYKGGSWKERRRSDNRLYRCVKSKKGWQNKFIAPVMWVGVRVFGTSILPTKFRWGFGKDRKKKKRSKRKYQDKSRIREK